MCPCRYGVGGAAVGVAGGVVEGDGCGVLVEVLGANGGELMEQATGEQGGGVDEACEDGNFDEGPTRPERAWPEVTPKVAMAAASSKLLPAVVKAKVAVRS